MQKQRLCASVLNQTIITWGFNALEYGVKGVATQGWTRIVLSINYSFNSTKYFATPPPLRPVPLQGSTLDSARALSSRSYCGKTWQTM